MSRVTSLKRSSIERQLRKLQEKHGHHPCAGQYFILEKGEVKEVDMPAWAAWFETCGRERIIKQNYTWHGYKVSTVFLGLNHNWGEGPPMIFELMVFSPFGRGMGNDIYQERYSTLEHAKLRHKQILRLCQIHPILLRWFA